MGTRQGNEVTGQAKLKGLRMVITSELEENQPLNGSLLKRLTSRDAIEARPLYKEPMTFLPTHTLILHTNHLPKLRSCDGGTKRRIAIAPFNSTIGPGERITDFSDKLLNEEGPQILQWMIDGAREFYEADMKLFKPKIVQAATDEYVQNEDRIGQFLNERCEFGDGFQVRCKTLFNEFKSWCEESNMYVGTQNSFAREISNHGVNRTRDRRMGYIYEGVKLLDEEEI